MTDLNVYQRIAEVQKQVKYVQKDVQVSGAGAYKAVSHDMVLAVLRPSMIEQGLVVAVKQLSGDVIQMRDPAAGIKMHLYSGDYRVSFVNVDNPTDKLKVYVSAHAADSGDKAPGKCLSYAVKTAMLKTFGLETGENEESRIVEEDISDISTEITAAETLEDLQAVFKLAWHTFPKSRPDLTVVYDARKKELTPDD